MFFFTFLQQTLQLSNVTQGKITLANPQHIPLQMRVKQGEPQPTGTAGKPVFIYRHLTHFLYRICQCQPCVQI